MNQSNAKEGSSSFQCTVTLIGQDEEIKTICIANVVRVFEYARRFTQGHWSFLERGSEKKWYGTHAHKLDGEWDTTAEGMMLNFAESGHPVFCASSALETGELTSKGTGVKTIHFNGCDETIELIFRTNISGQSCSISTEQLHKIARDPEGTWRPGAAGNLESVVIPTGFPPANPISQSTTKVVA